MKDANDISVTNSIDPVLREFARLAALISNDKGITKKERDALILRLEAERETYIHRNCLDANATTFATTNTDFIDGLVPTIRVMADFIGFSHQIIFPPEGFGGSAARLKGNDLLTPDLKNDLAIWQEEFENTAWDDYRSDRTRSMQWVAFDYAGLLIAKDIKQHVKGRARVIYEKAIQNPFNSYDGHLEVLSDGSILCRDDDPELTRILNASLSAPIE